MKRLSIILSVAALAGTLLATTETAYGWWGGRYTNPIGHRYYRDWFGHKGPYVRYPWMLGPAWGSWGGWWGGYYPWAFHYPQQVPQKAYREEAPEAVKEK
jgi:hypothetical protein